MKQSRNYYYIIAIIAMVTISITGFTWFLIGTSGWIRHHLDGESALLILIAILLFFLHHTNRYQKP